MARSIRYRLHFAGKWAGWSAILMALSFFASMVYSFGFSNLAAAGFGRAVFMMLFPAVISAAYVFLLRFRKLNAPGLYGVLGAALCACLLISSFFSGSVIRIILSILWYPVCAGAILGFVGGYLTSANVVTAVFAITIGVRFLFFSVSFFDTAMWIRELSVLSSLASLMLLPRCMIAAKFRN